MSRRSTARPRVCGPALGNSFPDPFIHSRESGNVNFYSRESRAPGNDIYRITTTANTSHSNINAVGHQSVNDSLTIHTYMLSFTAVSTSDIQIQIAT